MMSRKTGFTLVELLITVTIMVILMSLAVISLRSSQANARDSKRSGDTATIARALETRYNSGFTAPSSGWLVTFPSPPKLVDYPSTEEIVYTLGGSSSNFNPSTAVENFATENLPGSSKDSFRPPNSGVFRPICTTACTNQAEGTGINASSVGKDYVYEPLDANGRVCYSVDQDCVRFNLYFTGETFGLQTIRSKHQ